MSAAYDANEFYTGSDLLRPISEATGLSIDKINFVFCQLVSLLFGFLYRSVLGPHKVPPTTRHAVQVTIGVLLLLFCFGWQAKHLFAQTVLCLLMMRLLKPGIMEKVVFLVAMGYLCVTHIYRMVYDYGGYTLDITGPMMISTQRLTSLAYNVADGDARDESKLSDNMKRLAIRQFPSYLEYSSYIFSFHGIMAGPFCFYKDYIAFIDGTNYCSDEAQLRPESSNSNGVVVVRGPLSSSSDPPDPTSAIISKSVSAVICGLISAFIIPMFLCTAMIEPEFEAHSFLYKMLFLIAATSLHRQKYYFAWKLSELVNINAGLGFNGYDSEQQPLWNLIDNTDIYQVESASSLKVLLDNWNKTTTHWLRFVIYERYRSTLAVFLFSAFWHGFYIGYYITFLTGGICIHFARLVRRKVRPYFQTSTERALFYDLITFLATRVAIAYLTFPFVLLEFWPAVVVYRQLYFWLHITVIIAGVFLLALPKPPSSEAKQQ